MAKVKSDRQVQGPELIYMLAFRFMEIQSFLVEL